MALSKLLNLLLVALSCTPLTAARHRMEPYTSPARSGPESSSCSRAESVISSANLTGVYNIPGLILENGGLRISNDASDQWVLTQTVTDDRRALAIEEGFLTVPSDQTPETLPYCACAEVFIVPDAVARTRQTVDASCNQVFREECVRDLKDLYLTEAIAASNAAETGQNRCSSVFDAVERRGYPQSCRDSTESVFDRAALETSESSPYVTLFRSSPSHGWK